MIVFRFLKVKKKTKRYFRKKKYETKNDRNFFCFKKTITIQPPAGKGL